jgi:hypothetical protein
VKAASSCFAQSRLHNGLWDRFGPQRISALSTNSFCVVIVLPGQMLMALGEAASYATSYRSDQSHRISALGLICNGSGDELSRLLIKAYTAEISVRACAYKQDLDHELENFQLQDYR